MATGKVVIIGPITWVGSATDPLGRVLMPGDGHVWAIEVPVVGGVVYSVTAHPSRQAAVQALGVEVLSTAVGRPGEGAAAVNFIVRNVSVNGVFIYSMFIAAVAFA